MYSWDLWPPRLSDPPVHQQLPSPTLPSPACLPASGASLCSPPPPRCHLGLSPVPPGAGLARAPDGAEGPSPHPMQAAEGLFQPPCLCVSAAVWHSHLMFSWYCRVSEAGCTATAKERSTSEPLAGHQHYRATVGTTAGRGRSCPLVRSSAAGGHENRTQGPASPARNRLKLVLGQLMEYYDHPHQGRSWQLLCGAFSSAGLERRPDRAHRTNPHTPQLAGRKRGSHLAS